MFGAKNCAGVLLLAVSLLWFGNIITVLLQDTDILFSRFGFDFEQKVPLKSMIVGAEELLICGSSTSKQKDILLTRNF